MESDVVDNLVVVDPVADIFFLLTLVFFVLLIVGAIKTSKNVQEKKLDDGVKNSANTSGYIDNDI